MEIEKNAPVVVRLRPMGEMMKESKRAPVVPGGTPKDFAPRYDEQRRAIEAQQRRESTKAGAWAFASGMAWSAFVLIALYQLTGV